MALVLAAAAAMGCLAAATAGAADRWAAARRRMVEQDVVAAGVTNPRVVAAMRATPRHEFVPADQRRHAYLDMALPIGEQQTISPPFVVALMTESLDPQPADKVLEIGTGSGYQAAVLSGLVSEVYTIEIVESLGRRAAQTLKRLGYGNVQVKIGDGYQGWPEHAPFDKIIVTCSPERVPQALIEQVKEGGRIVIPVGQRYQQTLYLFKKVDGQLEAEALEPTMFVPMIGAAERERIVQPDPAHPAVVNGGFEESSRFVGQPDGWYYVRQAILEADPQAPQGKRYLTLSNTVPGRASQALQAFGIDGRRVRGLEISLWVKAAQVAEGQAPDQLPKLLVVFYDENRAPIDQKIVGPWSGSFDWTEEQALLHVPAEARLTVMAIGLMGGTGRVSFDAVELQAARVNRSALPQ